jgi:hypothetical protein
MLQMGRYLNGPANRLEHAQLFETLYNFAEDLSKALAQNEERAEKVRSIQLEDVFEACVLN